MTLEEAAQILRYEPLTIKKNFQRVQRTLAPKGIILTKWGRGKDVEYEIEYEIVEDDE